MKKPITIGVIDVIATILVTSAVDYSAIGAKPIDQFHLETTGISNGEVTCPYGDTIELNSDHLTFTEHDNPAHRGNFEMSDSSSTAFAITLWSGDFACKKSAWEAFTVCTLICTGDSIGIPQQCWREESDPFASCIASATTFGDLTTCQLDFFADLAICELD